MTATLPPNLLRTVEETRERVPLPGMSSPAWTDPATVWQIATYAERHVDQGAHALAHPSPLFGCPWCPQAGVCPSCGAEQTWREAA